MDMLLGKLWAQRQISRLCEGVLHNHRNPNKPRLLNLNEGSLLTNPPVYRKVLLRKGPRHAQVTDLTVDETTVVDGKELEWSMEHFEIRR